MEEDEDAPTTTITTNIQESFVKESPAIIRISRSLLLFAVKEERAAGLVFDLEKSDKEKLMSPEEYEAELTRFAVSKEDAFNLKNRLVSILKIYTEMPTTLDPILSKIFSPYMPFLKAVLRFSAQI